VLRRQSATGASRHLDPPDRDTWTVCRLVWGRSARADARQFRHKAGVGWNHDFGCAAFVDKAFALPFTQLGKQVFMIDFGLKIDGPLLITMFDTKQASPFGSGDLPPFLARAVAAQIAANRLINYRQGEIARHTGLALSKSARHRFDATRRLRFAVGARTARPSASDLDHTLSVAGWAA